MSCSATDHQHRGCAPPVQSRHSWQLPLPPYHATSTHVALHRPQLPPPLAQPPPMPAAVSAHSQNGEMVSPPGTKPVAAVPGTLITAEDLFYNMPARKKVLALSHWHGATQHGCMMACLSLRTP